MRIWYLQAFHQQEFVMDQKQAADSTSVDKGVDPRRRSGSVRPTSGMMAHWGLYTLLGGEWKGRSGEHPYGEWIMNSCRIPLKEYAELAKAFSPFFLTLWSG
jgi:hypothetical protein